MSLTIVAPPELEARLRAEAERQGVDTSSYALSLLEAAPNSVTPALSRPHLTAEVQAARVRLKQHFGKAHTGDPHSSDNERIDADLARAYADNHAGEQ